MCNKTIWIFLCCYHTLSTLKLNVIQVLQKGRNKFGGCAFCQNQKKLGKYLPCSTFSYILSLSLKSMHDHAGFCPNPDSYCKNLYEKSSTGLQRVHGSPCNVRAGEEIIQWAQSVLQILFADSKPESWESISSLIHF